MNLNLAEKNFLVTGGVAGIGAAIVKSLKQEGAEVFIADKAPTESQGSIVDIRQTTSIRDFVTTLPDLDGVVLNAALGPLHDDSSAIFETNVLGTLSVLHECKTKLSDFSSVVFLASTAGYREDGDDKWLELLDLPPKLSFDYEAEIKRLFPQETYRLTKWLLVQATRKFARELSSQRIRVNCVAPGPVKTNMSKALWQDNTAEWQRLITESPFALASEPMEVASAIVFLLSEPARMITGSFLHVDGGWFAQNAKYE